MKQIVCNDSLMIESDLPIESLLSMEIKQQLNDHGRLSFHIMIKNDKQADFRKKNYLEEQVSIFDIRGASPDCLFCGKIKRVNCEQKNSVMFASIEAVSYTVDLESERRRRSFQNVELTFEQVAHQVIKNTEAGFIWHLEDRKIGRPFIQFDETAWDFLLRLSSHFNCPLQTIMTLEKPRFCFGIHTGHLQVLDEAKVLEFGVSDAYYFKGGFASGHAKEMYGYLKVKHLASWEMGDYVFFEGNKYTVVERLIKLDQGELVFIDTLGASGLMYRPTIYNQALSGVQLQGRIEATQNESVFIAFDFDAEKQATYPWDWRPEIGNSCYIIPEVGSRAIVTCADDDEQNAIATHLLRHNGAYPSVEHHGILTIHDKLLGLYPDRLLLRGKDDNVRLGLTDVRGILMKGANVTLDAVGAIAISGNEVFVQAPERILMWTNKSSIEVCKNFNFFAPNGVSSNTSGSSDVEMPRDGGNTSEKTDLNHWQASFAALGSVPNGNVGNGDDHDFIRLIALGSVPKISDGHLIVSMSEVMKGIPVEETTFPDAIAGMESYTFNGGFYVQGG